MARINAVLRRRPREAPPGAPSADGGIGADSAPSRSISARALLVKRRRIRSRSPPANSRCSRCWCQHPRQPLSRDKLMELARGREHEAFDRAIDMQISRLRKLIEEDRAQAALHPDGVGLRLRVRARRRHGLTSTRMSRFPIWPRTLLGRTALVIAAAVLLSQLVAWQVFNLYNRGPRSEQVASLAASHLRTIATALETLSEDARDDFLDALEDTQGIKVVADQSAQLPAREPQQTNLRLFSEYVREQLGPETEFFVQKNGLNLWVRLPVANQAYWVSVPRNQIERRFPWVWIAWAAFSTLLALALAYLFVRRINRPLQQLVGAASAIGKGQQPAALPTGGAAELDTVNRAFNEMASDIEALNRERALLLAGVSHDLRTPLARLRLCIEMLNQTDAETKAGMNQDIEDMDAIVGQFLDFARDEAKRTNLRRRSKRCRARSLCGIRQTRRQDGNGIGTLPLLPIRMLAMKRLLNNLLENARRYGAAPITVRTGAEGNTVVLSVLDRGPGIRAEDAQRLLQPFTRASVARGDGGGSGLGSSDRRSHRALARRLRGIAGARRRRVGGEGSLTDVAASRFV